MLESNLTNTVKTNSSDSLKFSGTVYGGAFVLEGLMTKPLQ